MDCTYCGCTVEAHETAELTTGTACDWSPAE